MIFIEPSKEIMNHRYEMDINKLYQKWCKETKRNGAVLVGGSIREFFEWLNINGYSIIQYKTQ